MSLFSAILHELLDVVERNIPVSPEDQTKLQDLKTEANKLVHKATDAAADFADEFKDEVTERLDKLEEEFGNWIAEISKTVKADSEPDSDTETRRAAPRKAK